MILAVTQAVSNAELAETCGPAGDQSWACTQVYRITGSREAAEVAEALSSPLRIVLVLLAAWVTTRLLHRVVGRMVERIRDQGTLSMLASRARIPVSGRARIRRAQRAATVGTVLRNIVSIFVWAVAVLVVLGELGIDLAPLVAGAGVVGIALAFGTQTVVRDYLAGLFVVLEDQYGVGDEVDVGVASGTVEWVSLRVTRLRDADGVAWYVPNGEIRRVGNRSQRRPSPGAPAASRDDETADDGLAGDDAEPPADEG